MGVNSRVQLNGGGLYALVHSTCGFDPLEVISGGKTPCVVGKKFKTRKNKLLKPRAL